MVAGPVLETHGQTVAGPGTWRERQRDWQDTHPTPTVQGGSPPQPPAGYANEAAGEVNPLNAKKKSAEIEALLEQYIPGVERMQTQMRKYDTAYKALRAENAELKKQVDSSKESVRHRLEVSQQLQELEDLRRTVDNIPPEILQAYRSVPKFQKIER